MDGHCQRNSQFGGERNHNSPPSCHHPAETRPRHSNVSRRFWCMIQTHAHENKIHPVPARRNLLFRRFCHRPAKKPAHPRRSRGVEADQRPQRDAPPAGAQSSPCPRVSDGQRPGLCRTHLADRHEPIAGARQGQQRERYASVFKSPSFDGLRHKKLLETTADDFFAAFKEGKVAITYFLKRLHNFALSLGWIAIPIVAP